MILNIFLSPINLAAHRQVEAVPVALGGALC